MHFTSDWDWVPRGLISTHDVAAANLHIHHGGPIDPGFQGLPPQYLIESNTIRHSQPTATPALWVEHLTSILTEPSKTLVLLESRDGPEKPGFAAPFDVISPAVKALGLTSDQVSRVLGKKGSLTDYFFSESAADSSVELAFRWTSMPGSYLVFMGRFTPRLAVGKEEIMRMVGVVAHRGLFPTFPDSNFGGGVTTEVKKKEKKKRDGSRPGTHTRKE